VSQPAAAPGGEFELIARHFAGAPLRRARLGIGDDCALLADLPAGECLAVSTDMLVAGRHFFADADPAGLGWKSLAVNLSDLAAMGARPLAFTLALALPEVDDAWLAAFSAGLLEIAGVHDCELVGGDTTRGPLTMAITVFGSVPPSLALRRDAGRAGDDLWVSGPLGAAAWAVVCRQAGRPLPAGHAALDSLDRPQPRVSLGRALLGTARAAIDLSDGLLGDLGHVCKRSRLGARLDWPAVPVAACLRDRPLAQRLALALAGGDDYELLFSAPPAARETIAALAAAAGHSQPPSRIGTLVAEPGIRLLAADGTTIPIDELASFDHFR
jgi:thiamine-monophosphate kinase